MGGDLRRLPGSRPLRLDFGPAGRVASSSLVGRPDHFLRADKNKKSNSFNELDDKKKIVSSAKSLGTW